MFRVPAQSRKSRSLLPVTLLLGAVLVPVAVRFAPSFVITAGARIRAALVCRLEGAGCGQAFPESVNLFTLDCLLGNCGWVE